KGVGPKLAARLVTELKDKAPLVSAKVMAMGGTVAMSNATGDVAPLPEKSAKKPGKSGTAVADTGAMEGVVIEEAVSALTHLGYGRSEACEAVARVRGEISGKVSVEVIVPRALRVLSGEKVGA